MSARLAEAARIARCFSIGGSVLAIEPLGRGLINDTFRVDTDQGRWVLQRVNGTVFPEPQRIMENLAVLSEHLAGRTGADLRIPTPVPALDGRRWVRGDDGGLWRLMAFVEGARVLPRIENPAQAAEVGRVLGAFHRLVHDLPCRAMAVTLPGLHVTPRYLDAFLHALRRAQGACHGPEIRAAIAFVAARRGEVGVLEEARSAGKLPERIVHGDPKLDNVLFDPDGARALGLIDLDTVQPGLALADLGDCLRSCCNRPGESGRGEAAANFDLHLCRAVLGAYAREMGNLLRPEEVALLYQAVRLIPLELGMRFLTDHLEGDRYFRVAAPGENLAKARVQLALVEEVERKERAIRAIIADCFDPTGTYRP
jgi:Ser/Thr protein kinase RdoA (MazF antagonist)